MEGGGSECSRASIYPSSQPNTSNQLLYAGVWEDRNIVKGFVWIWFENHKTFLSLKYWCYEWVNVATIFSSNPTVLCLFGAEIETERDIFLIARP